MKMSTLFRFVLLLGMSTAVYNVTAGSAVMCGRDGHVVYSFGHPE